MCCSHLVYNGVFNVQADHILKSHFYIPVNTMVSFVSKICTVGDFKFSYNLVLNFGFKPKLGSKPKLSGNLKWR